MTTPVPMYRLVERDLLERLMKRTGTGAPISIRGLAKAVGVSHGTIGNLLSGHTRVATEAVAHAVCRVIGVDLPILWVPVGRAVPAEPAEAPTNAPQAVSA